MGLELIITPSKAHSSNSILSLQGKTPLKGHPKTLRDLSQALDVLTLPSAFGNIQLGETFTSCLCLNNEADCDVGGVIMKVEIQTTTSKIEIASFGGPDFTLPLNGAMNEVVSHEIKELGQHVLACTVSYSSRHANAHDTANADHHTFRKFYKFSVTLTRHIQIDIQLIVFCEGYQSAISQDESSH